MDLTPAQRRALQAGDPSARSAFFEAYFDPLYQYIWRMVGRAHLAEDLAQDTFMQIQRTFDRYDPARPLKPWVYTIATNLVRDYWRSRQHQESVRQEEWQDTLGRDRLSDGRPSPDETLQSGETGEEVAMAVQELPDSLRDTFVLRFYEELPFADIAAIAERSEVAVRKRFSRALEELRSRLGHMDPKGQEFLRQGRVR